MASVGEWIAGARPRTLPAAAAPVFVGSGAAALVDSFSLLKAALAMLLAIALQVGVNYANDYSDGVRGTDVDRVGPVRLTASGLAAPQHVKYAAFGAFGLGSILGIILIAMTGHWWLLAVGVLCILAGWYYTGGKKPYGYAGLGEVGVFVFFGLVATMGTTYLQAGRVTWPSALGAVAIGLIACAILMANNIRDIPTDFVSGKKTLAVRVGDFKARRMYIAMIWVPLLLAVVCAFFNPWALLTLFMLLPAVLLSIPILAGAKGKLLVPVLAGTGMYELGFGILLGIGLAL
ncbi:1,4-dihydroxy-2-naphthoate polyprenyltransferase [Timonella senegalensis]|uniref:1,4-dihydroxy-2-naphthoate polyprenyltransferase n=1 Tax=Timonella senegalensis TaxID=1465825 RepID=UPI0028A7D444|nr:1,4-dihydroxy-2-naphthoate polyprenyltransferase [Timonella senegalensis]